MAEETGGNQKKNSLHKQSVRSSDNGWIVCRSQKRPGLFYDFNTLTGEAVWRDPNKIEAHHNTLILDQNHIKFDCHEPTEPPLEPVGYNQNVTQTNGVPKMYNKQIINNQYSTKPFTVGPFGETPCTQYSLLNPNNIGMNATPTHVWVVPPITSQVLLGPGVTPLNQVQSIFGCPQNLQIQNTQIPLSNRFQVLNNLNSDRPPLSHERLGPKNSCHMPVRNNRNFVKNHVNQPNDLRSILSGRNRHDMQNDPEDRQEPRKEIPNSVTEDELILNDIDEWLEVHMDGEGKKLNIDLECIWELADSCASRDHWYIVTSTRVLLNNIRFLCSLVISDDRLRLVAPRHVVRGLRSATFSDKSHLAECAKRLLCAIRQTGKLSDTLKDAPDFKFCLEFMKQNKHVILLIDENDVPNQHISDVPKFTVNELKQYLTQNSKATTVSNAQKICENIKIIVPNNEAKLDITPVHQTTPNRSPQETPNISTETLIENKSPTGIKEIQIQTEVTAPSQKQTANASVQTDFDFNVVISSTKEKKLGHDVDVTETSNDNVISKAEPRKIRLKRQHHSTKIINTEEKKTFKWRKRKVEKTSSTSSLTLSQFENGLLSTYGSSLPSTATSDLIAQQNDSTVECGFSDGSVIANIVEETSTSGVVSNSIDSEPMFKISKQTILNESKAEEKQEIVMYDVTTDFMKDHLTTRCDEWVSRFNQIMEEVLKEVVRLEPPFIDSTLPAPWTIPEATVCIKRKLKHHKIIGDAADKLSLFFFQISDKRGNIKKDISPTEFMHLFSYSVNLINALQSELKNCGEDLQEASKSLFKLLSDIKEPNLDELDEETFRDDDTFDHSANVSESMTNLSATDLPANTDPAIRESPLAEKLLSCPNSPARYSLRSSRGRTEKNIEEEEKSEAIDKEKKESDYSLFSSLGLTKKVFNVDSSIVKTIVNNPQDQPPLTLPLALTDRANNNEHFKINNASKVEPKIIIKFSKCPELEKKLDIQNSAETEFDDRIQDDYLTEGDKVEDNFNFAQDVDIENGFFGDDINYDGMILQTSAMDVDQYSESVRSGDLDASTIFKWVVQRTTYDYHRCLVKLRKFCEDTHEELKNIDYWEPEYKTFMMDMTTEANSYAINVCSRLRCILNREPVVTKNKFRDMLNVFGIQDYDMKDTQLEEYRVIIEKYLKHADLLLTFVSLLANHFKEK